MYRDSCNVNLLNFHNPESDCLNHSESWTFKLKTRTLGGTVYMISLIFLGHKAKSTNLEDLIMTACSVIENWEGGTNNLLQLMHTTQYMSLI
jgi:hypothetical protein